MRRTAATLFALALAAGAVAVAMEGEAHPTHTALNPAELTWGPAPAKLPPGAQLAVVLGDPSKEGEFVIRAKMPAGYKIPPHWHPSRENVTVLSGALNVGAGEKFDPAAGKKLTPGGFVSLPPLMAHYAWSDVETEIQVHAMGPFALIYVDPKDDPTAKKP